MEEKKVDEVDAATSPRQDENEESSAKVDAATSPRQEAEDNSSERGEVAASTIDWKDLYARLKADFDNYKKRAARDREDVYRYAEADILKDILPSVDNLKLALDNAKLVDAATSPRQNKVEPPERGEVAASTVGDAAKFASFVKGVQLVADTLLKSLKEHGAEPFDSVGEKLDTEKMEAISMMPSADVEEGKVVAEVKKGWMLKGKVLRAAQVVVSSGKSE